ncbi:IS982 family transposase [Bacteroides heparinolyticus]|uniref:IS982 family transposase n=1 Tax=Prevotella heparinolytica TaxID=28113 RepID=UPI003FA0406E
MNSRLCILLIFSKLKVNKLLIKKYRMHNLYAIFAKFLNICKQVAGNLVNESGNVPKRGVVPKFSDLEIVALSMTSEAVGIDSESLLFAKLQEYKSKIPNLISRRQYNDRRKTTSFLCNTIRERMASEKDGGEEFFCIDSKPIETCRFARSKRCRMGKKNIEKAPSIGYCASQGMYYYGYKLHTVCGLSGVIHSFDLTKACVHDIHFLKDVKADYSNCTVIADKGYISAQVQPDLFETANIRLEVPYRSNQKEWKPTYPAFAKARKRIETIFSQLCDQFMIIRNYAKDTDGLFARIIGKISALTILQYINYKNNKPIGRVKYALI